MKAKITYEGMQRIERYFVPDAALREALLNSLCHKQYEDNIICTIFDKRTPKAQAIIPKMFNQGCNKFGYQIVATLSFVNLRKVPLNIIE